MSEVPRALPRAAIIAVGDELLYGSTIDTNGAWLGERFAALGMPVHYRSVVGDDDDAIAGALVSALKRADVVVMSGGLGPTPDDHTREAVARHLGLELHPDPDLLEDLKRRFQRFGHTSLPPQNAQQAMVPAGARVLANRQGSAPGLLIEAERGESGPALVFLVPGVPVEMRGLFEDAIEPTVRERFADRLQRVRHRLIHTSGIAESVLSGRVSELLPEDLGPVSVAFLPKRIGVDVRLTAIGSGTDDEAATWITRVEEAIAPSWRGYAFDAETGDLVEALGRELKRQRRTLAVAESCTGGLVLRRLTELPGASDFLRGGIVAYDNDVKVSLLGVPRSDLDTDGAVSECVAKAMALGACRALGADAGISVTGVAGPAGGSKEKPVGTVWYAVAVDGTASARCRRFHGDRAGIRVRSAQAALNLLYRTLLGDSP